MIFGFADPMKPIILISSKSPNNGDNVTFTCNVTSNDGAVEYAWYYNDTKIFGETKETYTITDVTSKRNGNYHCIAKSSGISKRSDKKILSE